VRSRPFDPAPELAALREERPLCRLRFPDGHVGWLATGYVVARAILGDERFSVRPLRFPIDEGGFLEALEAGAESAGNIAALDAPAHTRLRRLQTPYFTVRRVSQHRPAIERIVSMRLDAMEAAGPPVDLVETFSLPVAAMAMCELLGVPHSDRARFEQPAAVITDMEGTTPEEKTKAMADYYAYTRSVLERKRRNPSGDLLSELLATGELSDEELSGIAMVLFGAGHDTTSTMLSWSTFLLLYDRDRWENLRVQLPRIDGPVEELLRYLTINQLGPFARTALEDVQLGGIVIKQGESVAISLAAANRDASVFADPDRFDLSRDARGQLAFGHGRHMCLGQHLARLEVQIGLSGLMERFPTLRIAVPVEEVELRSGQNHLAGVDRLPVTWREN
jgi:cytochrome P450